MCLPAVPDSGTDFIQSVASGQPIEAIPYSSQISVGSRLFSDRDYYFLTIGNYSADTFYIRGPNNDKDTPAASPQWIITVNVPVIVYLDFWGGQETMGFAQWKDGWNVSSMSPTTFDHHTIVEGPGVVYEKYFAAGEIVLYGNDGNGAGTYLVFVTRAPERSMPTCKRTHTHTHTNTQVRYVRAFCSVDAPSSS